MQCVCLRATFSPQGKQVRKPRAILPLGISLSLHFTQNIVRSEVESLPIHERIAEACTGFPMHANSNPDNYPSVSPVLSIIT